MADADAWLIFGALLFLFMGLGLAVEPEAYAKAAADWPSLTDGESREASRQMARWCRACGTLFLAVSAWGWAAVSGLPVGLAARLAALHLAPAARLAAGAAATLASLSMTSVKIFEWYNPTGKAAPRGAAFWSGWGVVLTLLGFGAFLLARTKLL